jgi:hypothetical protein
MAPHGIAPPIRPVVTYQSICRALSQGRFTAYSLNTDHDSADAVARYLWNVALASALWPAVHLLEVTFRNTLYEAGVKATRHRTLAFNLIPCWLDARPSLLQEKQRAEVERAVTNLGTNPRRHSAGHLITQLGFGFWVSLCNSPYDQGNKSGPQLWPEATYRFPNCPRTKRNRADIRIAFDEARLFRNDLAHHQPAWDRDPVGRERRILELLAWMNPTVAAAATHASTVAAIYASGPGPYRTVALAMATV